MKNFHYSKVIDNNDQNAPDGIIAGRVKIQIPYIHGGTEETLLPWAKPMNLFSGGSGTYGKSNTPEIDSWVWVIFDDDIDFLRPFFIADISLNNMHPHMLFENNIKSKITEWSSSYPDVKYSYYKNGICIAISSNETTPEIVVYHPSGSYSYINNSGDYKIIGVNEISISSTKSTTVESESSISVTSTEGVEIKSGDVATEPSVLGNKLVLALTQLCTALQALTVTCTAPGTPSSVPINAPAFSAISANLSTILSALNKNN